MSHGRRMSTKMYGVAYSLKVAQDGEKCKHCGWTWGDAPSAFQKKHPMPANLQRLEIDHVDGNPWNNPEDGSNWQLLCKSCNVWKGVASMGGGVGDTGKGHVDVDESGRTCIHKEGKVELKERGSMTSIIKQQVDFTQGDSQSLKISGICEPKARKYCLETVQQRGQVKWKDLRDEAAEASGCATKTMERNYLAKITSRTGPLQVMQDEFGEKWVTLRPVAPEEKRGRPRKEAK